MLSLHPAVCSVETSQAFENDGKTPTKPKFSHDLTLYLLLLRVQTDYRIFRNLSPSETEFKFLFVLQGFTAVTLHNRQLCRNNTFIRPTSPREGTVGLRRQRQSRLSHVVVSDPRLLICQHSVVTTNVPLADTLETNVQQICRQRAVGGWLARLAGTIVRLNLKR